MVSSLHTFDVEVYQARASRLGPEWTRSAVRDSYARLYYVESGGGWLRYRGRDVALKPGWIYLVPGDTLIAYGPARNMFIYWIHFTASTREGLDLFSLWDCSRELVAPDVSHVRTVFADVISASRQTETPAAGAAAEGGVLLLLARFLQTARPQNRRRVMLLKRLGPVLDYIETHAAKRPAVAELAARAGMETSYFSVLFRELTGLPPAAYVRRRRLKTAQFLLLNSERTLQEIAAQTGFCDAFHFSRVFKREFGLPPSTFRNRSLLP